MQASNVMLMTTNRGPARRVFRSMRTFLITGVAGLVAFLVLGNLVIFSATLWAKEAAAEPAYLDLAGVPNGVRVDGHLWRGAAPTDEGYRSLAAGGVKTIVDLRAEEDIVVNEALLDRLGVRLVRIPMRDGQAPTPQEVDRFLAVVKRAEGKVFVHCGAGVGRTGAMVGSYLVDKGVEPMDALQKNLSIGPPSLEQITFVAALSPDDVESPAPLMTALSRVLDAPRRILTRF